MSAINDNPRSFRSWEAAVVRIYDILRELNSSFGTTYFVAPEGNDNFGKVGDISFPFKTILAAVNKAVADGLPSPLVYVFPGIYPEDSLQYDGSFFFTPGSVVTGRSSYHGTTGVVSATPDDKSFVTPGNFEEHFNVPGKKFRISGGANEGIYTVDKAFNTGGNTTIITIEDIPSTTSAGRLNDGMGIFYCGPVSATYLLYGTAALDCKVYGELTVNRAESIDGDWSGGAIDIGQDAEMFVECHSIYLQQGIGVYMQNNAKLTLKGEFFEIEKSGYGATVRDESESVFMFQRIKHSGLGGGFIGNCFFVRQGATAGFSGTCRVEAEELIADGGASALQFVNVLTGAIIYVEATDMDTSTWAINNQSHSGGEIKIQGNIRSPLGIFNTGSNGYLKFTGDLVANADSTSFNDINSGNVYINGDVYHNSTPTAIAQMVKCDGGTLRINGKISNTTTGGYGINKTSGNLVLDTVKIISDSDSITAATAQNINVIHSLACDKALNSNVTNIVTGSNVIIDSNVI